MLNAQLRSQVLLLIAWGGLYSGKGSEQVLKLSLAADLCSTLQSGIIFYSWWGFLFWEREWTSCLVLSSFQFPQGLYYMKVT